MFTGKLADISMCERIEKKLRELQKSGKGMSSPEGMILAYMTPDDIQVLPEMKELVDVIMRADLRAHRRRESSPPRSAAVRSRKYC